MKTVLVAINAKHVHTNLAVRYISAYLEENSSIKTEIAEYTINNRSEIILAELFHFKADTYIFSAYIWNIDIICELAAELKKILPDCIIISGGPQVSYNQAGFLRCNPAFDYIVSGEGELICTELLEALKNSGDATGVAGVTYRGQSDNIIQNPAPESLPDMNKLPFAYRDIKNLDGRILYYESMRGCPFRCSYCLSSIGGGVRFKNIDIVKNELKRLSDATPKQVKFVDRTFNCNKQHAMSVWEYLVEIDNGHTNFHFELAGELLDDEMIDFLSSIRPGLFQFEIGVQTTNSDTLAEIQRPADLKKLFSKVERLQKPGNIHLHLDLIAALPYEDYNSFVKSFNDVYAARPNQFQLGFLKVLSGSNMEKNAEKYGLVYTGKAPFEALFTNWIDYEQLRILHGVADMVELYYNSGRFSKMVEHLCGLFPSPFDFYLLLYKYYKDCGYDIAALGKKGQYELLAAFSEHHGHKADANLQWLCRFDIASHEKPKMKLGWIKAGPDETIRKRIRQFYNNEDCIHRYLPEYAGLEPKNIAGLTHIEVMPFDPETNIQTDTVFLFNYANRDITGRAYPTRIALP